jgi:hypothetical protein
MILKNRRTREEKNISLSDFKKNFAKDIQAALDSYCKTQNNKPYFAVTKCRADYESEFNFDLQWNFNNFGNSAWFIKKM